MDLSAYAPEIAGQVHSAFQLSGYVYDDADAARAGKRKIQVGAPSWQKVAVPIFSGLKSHHVLNALGKCPTGGADEDRLFGFAWDQDILEQAGVEEEALDYLTRRTNGLSAMSVTGDCFKMALDDQMLLCQGSVKIGGVLASYRFLTESKDVAYTYYFAHVKEDLRRAMERIGKKYQPVLDLFPELEARTKRELGSTSDAGRRAIEARTPLHLTTGGSTDEETSAA